MANPFHHQLMQDLDAAMQSGELTYAQHSAMRAELRNGQMAGRAYHTKADLMAAVAGAFRDTKGRFAN